MQEDIESGHFGGRGDIWRTGLQLVREHPLAGVGAGAFGAAVEPTLRRAWSAHQTFLSILVEQGIIGLLLFLTMMAAAIKPLRYLPTFQRRFSIVLLAALATASLSASWEYQKQLWFVLGLLAAQTAQRFAARVVPLTAVVRVSSGAMSLPR